MKKSIFLILLLLLNSCSPVKIIEPEKFKLGRLSHKHYAAKPSKSTIIIAKPTASAGYKDDDMLYIAKPYQVNSFVKHQWIAPPAEMLKPLLVQSIQNTGLYHAVLASPYGNKADLRLETELLKLQQNFLTHPSQIELVIKATLVNESNNQVIASRQFVSYVKAPSDTPYGGVIAANLAIENILDKMMVFLVKASH